MFKKIREYFASVDVFTFVCYFVMVLMLAGAIFGMAYSIYYEVVNHYDITVTLVNGDTEVVHCRSYYKKGDYLFYNINGDEYYISLKNVVFWSISEVECNCNNA